jgi:dipeptidyl aminopeptidase/acylaminoacyl peptidase
MFFGESSRFAASISPDGSKVAYLFPDDRGINSVWAVNVEGLGDQWRISPSNGVPVSCFFWTGSNELLWQCDGPDGGASLHITNLKTGEARELLPNDARTIRLEGMVDSEDPCILIGLSDAACAFPDLFRLRLRKSADPELVCPNSDQILTWAWNGNGAPVAGVRWTATGAKELLSLRQDCPRVVLRVEPADDLRLLMASRDGSKVLVLTNRGGDLTHLEWLALESGKSQPMGVDPLNRVDLEGLLTTGENLLAASYSDTTIRWHALNHGFSAALKAIQNHAGSDSLNVLGVDQSKTRILFKKFSARDPGTVWLHDTKSGNTSLLWHERPGIDPATLCETRAVEYPARDGTRIPAYLTLPNSGRSPWPLVVFPHGGPRMRTHTGFDGRVQFLASRGYAVLQPNFRGSRGYGKAFMNAGDCQWGKGVMQTDVTDGVDHLISEGVADPRRIAILGGSYGGYAALAGLAFTPDRYAAGICLFGISDLIDYATHHPTEWLAYAGDTVRRLGDPFNPTGQAELLDRSPLHHAAAFKAPLLLYHGMKDPLIPVRHAKRMTDALQNCGKQVEFLLAPDESHGFSNPEAEMAVYRAIELFLHEHLGGQVGPKPLETVSQRFSSFRSAALAAKEPGKTASPAENAPICGDDSRRAE